VTYETNHPICILAEHTERFIQERRFLKGVSPATEAWYKYSLKAFAPVLSEPYQSTTALKAAVTVRIQRLITENRGNKAVSINTYLRCLKAFLRWAHEEGILREPVKLPWLKEEEKVLATFSQDQLNRLISWKPVSRSGKRLHLLTLAAIDTGLRISELLGLCGPDVDLENLVLRVKGKGNKHRLVPMSMPLRKLLYRHIAQHEHTLIFCTRDGGKLSQRDILRDFRRACSTLGISGVRCSLHTLRHSFAVNYLRAGGNLYYLQRIMGHSDISTTQRYLRSLGVDDLQAVHDRLSPLSPERLRGTLGRK
jgi:integrase/recombinase XerD